MQVQENIETKLKMFAIYDAKLPGFMTPFFVPNEALAVREMINLLNDARHPVTINAEDFTLYELGEFSTQFGTCNREEPRAVLPINHLKLRLNGESNA